MRRISDIELHEMKKTFEHICVNILGIPKDAVYFKQETEGGERYGIYCDRKYFDRFADYMLSLDGWQEKTESEEQNDNDNIYL